MSVGKMQEQFAGKRCVAVLHDSGTRYLETVFNDEWVSDSLGCTSEELNYLVGSSSFDLCEGVNA